MEGGGSTFGIKIYQRKCHPRGHGWVPRHVAPFVYLSGTCVTPVRFTIAARRSWGDSVTSSPGAISQ